MEEQKQIDEIENNKKEKNSNEVELLVIDPYDEGGNIRTKVSTDSTIREVKEKLQTLSPSQPTPEQQRLIYKGKICDNDEMILEKVINSRESSQSHTFHLMSPRISPVNLGTSRSPSVMQTQEENKDTTEEEEQNHRNSTSNTTTTATTTMLEPEIVQQQQQQQQQQPPPPILHSGNTKATSIDPALVATIAEHRKSVQFMMHQQQLLSSSFTSLLSHCIQSPHQRDTESSNALLQASEALRVASERLTDYVKRHEELIKLVEAESKMRISNLQQNQASPSLTSSAISSNVHNNNNNNNNNHSAPQIPVLAPAPVPLRNRQQLGRITPNQRWYERAITQVLLTELRIIAKLLLMLFVLGHDAERSQFWVLVGLMFAFYLWNSRILRCPQFTSLERLARIGRIPNQNYIGGPFLNVRIIFVTFFLSIFPGWMVLPLEEEIPQQQQQQQPGPPIMVNDVALPPE